MFKSHQLFQDQENALQIIAYFDEIEVCNPLGAQRGIHKLGETLNVRVEKISDLCLPTHKYFA